MLGRLLGGIVIFILYSVFEFWMIYEYYKVGGVREVIFFLKKIIRIIFWNFKRIKNVLIFMMFIIFI